MTRQLNRQQAVALAIIIVSYLMIILDISIVITGLSYIQKDIRMSRVELSWVQSIYTLFLGGGMLLGARSGDIIGGRKALTVGLYIFMATSLAIAFSASPFWLLVARAGQGLGAAFIAPSALTLLSTNFSEGEERNRALSWYSSTAGIGSSLGLIVGGVFADCLSWRVGFLMNVPVGMIILGFAHKYLTETEPVAAKMDILGAVLSTVGVGAIIYGVMEASATGWGALSTIWLISIGAVTILIFLLHEGRTTHPLLPLSLFMHRRRTGAYIVRFLFLGPMVGFFFFGSVFMQGVRGYTALQTAIGFLPMTISAFFVALRVPALMKVWDQNAPLVLGLSLSATGLVCLSMATANSSYGYSLALPMVLIGSGQGLCFPPMTAAGLADTTSADRGAASGMINVSHQLGASFGVALLTFVSANHRPNSSALENLQSSCQIVFLIGGGILLLATLLASVLILPKHLYVRSA